MKEARETIQDFAKIRDVAGKPCLSRVAILQDYRNNWDAENDIFLKPLNDLSLDAWFKTLQRNHIPFDFVDFRPESTMENLASYDLLIAPHDAVLTEKQAALPKKEYDLVICGLGIGGIVTAIRAAQDGLKPVILEKMSSASGNTIYSAGFMLGVNTKMQQEKKLETGDTVDKFYEDMMKVSQGRGDPKLTRLVAEKADETLNWLHDYVGVKYAVGMKLVWPMLQRAHLTIGEKKPGGTQLMLYLLAKAKELNVPIVYNAKAVELLDNPQNGKVIGVKVKSKEGFEEYFGKYGVVMATGGFSANKMMLTMMAGVPAANMPVRGSHSVTGESILLTGPYFPKVVNVDQYHCGPIHGPTGANPLNIVNTGIAVSKETKRYTDEGKTYVPDVS